jgi:small conductance mechanosensitive channel
MVGDDLESWYDSFIEQASNWLSIHLATILFILAIAWIARRFANKLIDQIIRRSIQRHEYPTKSDRDRRIRTLNKLMSAIMRTSIYIVAGILLIGEISPVPVSALLASAGLIGVAIGFGAQSLVKDITAGVFIIIENQYRIGDVVDISGVSGTVEDITIRTTVLRDLNGNLHHVPNGSIVVTTNKTIEFSRINEDITVDLGTDVSQLEHLINHVGSEVASQADLKDYVIEAPKFLRVTGYAPNGMVVKVVGKTKAGKQWQVKGEFYRLLSQAFDKHKIKIAQNPLLVQHHKTKKS